LPEDGRQQVDVQIQNVVASGDLSQRLDLESILRVTPGARYKPEQFPGLVYRLRKPRTATLLFSSGKMICTGAKSERSAKAAMTRIVNELRRHGIVIVGKPEVRIENIVASGDLGGTIGLEDVAAHLTRTMYEPEQFPGLIFRMDEPKTVILIFASGKLVITGAKREPEVRLAAEKLRAALDKSALISYDARPSLQTSETLRQPSHRLPPSPATRTSA
jgi:transcription initiation factor TFIID TATA-box-binding protein